MRWMFAKLVSLIGTIAAALLGAAASQTLAFINAYQQRLGGHVDEARRTLQGIQHGTLAGPPTDPAARDQLAQVFTHRLAELQEAHQAILQAGVFRKPMAFIGHMDREIASATLDAFTPAVPLDLPSLVFALAGIAIGWALWETGRGAAGSLVRRRG